MQVLNPIGSGRVIMAKRSATKKAAFTAACVNCGSLIPEGAGILKNGMHYCDNCKSVNVEKEAFLSPKGFVRIISYILSLNPVIGFLLGTVYYAQTGTDNRAFARKCYLFMTIGLFVGLVFFILFIVAGAMTGGLDGGSGFQESYY
jgi:hypothetical protein